MPSSHRQQAVMFADVSGSSRLYKQLGNTRAKARIDATLQRAQSIVEHWRGTVVKVLGDEIMVRFDSAEHACRAATDLQRPSQQYRQLALRVGIAYGTTLMDSDGDIFGDVVNDAADVSHIAQGLQIVVTDALVAQLPQDLAQECQAFDQVTLKGDKRLRTVYRLHWEAPTHSHSATTVMEVHKLAERLSTNTLKLTDANTQRCITPEQLPLTFGRDGQRVHWRIDSHKVSREHCHIIYRRGKYVLVDHSTNGTYIQNTEEAQTVYIRREETPLTGSGKIGFGQPPNTAKEAVVSFSITASGH